MVRLVPMSNSEYEAYLAFAVRDYADEKVAAGNWQPAEALERSAQEYQKLLPQGVATPDNYWFKIEDQTLATTVGMIWLARISFGTHPVAFIYDFRVDERFRRRGYGQQALRAAEEQVKALGFDRIALHVFGHNHAARALYEKMGYEITNISMSKNLAP